MMSFPLLWIEFPVHLQRGPARPSEAQRGPSLTTFGAEALLRFFAFATALRKLCEMERPGAQGDLWHQTEAPNLAKLYTGVAGVTGVTDSYRRLRLCLDRFVVHDCWTAPMLHRTVPPHTSSAAPRAFLRSGEEMRHVNMAQGSKWFQGADSLPAMRLGSIFPLVSTAMTLQHLGTSWNSKSPDA